MTPTFFLYSRIIVFGFFAALLIGCSHHAYVGMPPGQPMRDVEIPSGNTTLIPIGSSFIGAAYEEASDHLFLRIVPGTQLQELDRNGNRLRSFSAQQVTAGCDGAGPESDEPSKECGLAMRYSDRHFFLDHPGGLLIAEVDINGAFIRNIRVAQPDGPIGGLAYDQQTDTIYILFVRSRMVAEIDLMGNQLRRFRPFNPQVGASIFCGTLRFINQLPTQRTLYGTAQWQSSRSV